MGDPGDVHTAPPPFDTALPDAPGDNRRPPFQVRGGPDAVNGELAYLQSGVQAGLVEESVSSLRNLLLLMVPAC